jgi:hypothetical protein
MKPNAQLRDWHRILRSRALLRKKRAIVYPFTRDPIRSQDIHLLLTSLLRRFAGRCWLGKALSILHEKRSDTTKGYRLTALGLLVDGFVVPVLGFPLRGLVPPVPGFPAPVPPVVGFLVVDFPAVGFPGVDFPVVGFLVVGFPVPVVGFLVGGGVVGSEQDFSGVARRPRIKSIARRNGRRDGGAQALSGHQ